MWIKREFRDYYIPKLRRELKRDPSQEEMDRRGMVWKEPISNYNKGVMAKYAKLVSSASIGAVTS